MRKMTFVAVSLLPLIISGTAYAQNCQANASALDSTDLVDPNFYQETPPPTKPDNHELPLSSLISREDILSSRVLPDSARNLSLQLTTYGDYASSEGGVSPDIALGRQVWVLKDEYPAYEHYRFGKMENAQVTTAFDAETGEMLGTGFVGTPLEGFIGHPSPSVVVPFTDQ